MILTPANWPRGRRSETSCSTWTRRSPKAEPQAQMTWNRKPDRSWRRRADDLLMRSQDGPHRETNSLPMNLRFVAVEVTRRIPLGDNSFRLITSAATRFRAARREDGFRGVLSLRDGHLSWS